MKKAIGYIACCMILFVLYSCNSSTPIVAELTSHCDTCYSVGYYDNDLLNRFYYQNLYYPKDLNELLDGCEKGVMQMLTNQFDDSVEAKKAFDNADLFLKKGKSHRVWSEAYLYLFYYKELEKNKNYLDYKVEDKFVVIRDNKSKKIELNYKYDINEQVNDEASSRCNNVYLSSFFFDKDSNIVSIGEEELREWVRKINDATRVHDDDEICVMLEFSNGNLHPYNRTYYKDIYNSNKERVLPVVVDFLSKRTDVVRVVFPIFVVDTEGQGTGQ